MTIVTTVVAGMLIEGVHPLQQISQFYRGLPYAGTLLVILFSHEMGHYLTARHYGMDVTLPYFLPAPPPLFFIGTLGAFIRMRSPAQHRRALLYIAAAGPIAGFCVALPAAIYAYATSTIAPVNPTADGVYFGEPLLLQIYRVLYGRPCSPGCGPPHQQCRSCRLVWSGGHNVQPHTHGPTRRWPYCVCHFRPSGTLYLPYRRSCWLWDFLAFCS